MMSEQSPSTRIPKDMVFSQTSFKAHSILKVLEIDHLKAGKNQQVNGSTGVITDGSTVITPPSPVATTSFSEVYLKPEPLYETEMFHEQDSEFFQDLVQWCSDPAKEELEQTTDSPKKTDENALNTDALPTTFSPQGWDVLDANSPASVGYYNTTPNDPLSPNEGYNMQLDNKFFYSNTHIEQERKSQLQEQIWDITNLPVVLGDLASEKMVDLNPVVEPIGYYNNTYDTDYTKTDTYNKMLYLDNEDSLDIKLDSVIPREVENNDVVISEYIINEDLGKGGVLERTRMEGRASGLSLNVPAPMAWSSDIISTPEVLSYVEQLETEKCRIPVSNMHENWPAQDSGFVSANISLSTAISTIEYQPITPKSESHIESDAEDVKSRSSKRRRHISEDSDETYTPYTETTPRKYKRRKPSIPIKDMIIALEGSHQLTKARRGRPPKRRESTVSSVCSIDDNASSTSKPETMYRIIREKNNEASKRSRMNRKLKELQMEKLAEDLELRNKQLQVKADILEEMTKKLRDALMSVITQKK